MQMIQASFKLIIFSLLASFSINAQEACFDIVKRNKKEKLVVANECFSGLNGKFENKYFRIVNGIDDKAISFDSDLANRAANVLYHLERARNYFAEVLKSEHVINQGQVIIRIEMTRAFNEIARYGNINIEPEFNNAVTIPNGVERPNWGISGWSQEIWFRPKKKIKVPVDNPQEQQMIVNAINQYSKSTYEMTFYEFVNSALATLWEESDYNILTDATTKIESSMMTFLTGLAAKTVSGIFFSMDRTYYLDTAYIPEVIYHEYSHFALNDFIPLQTSTPVNEGYADFFASQISGTSKIAHKARKYSRSVAKDGESTQKYSPAWEKLSNAHEDHVFSLLYQVNKVIGNHPEVIFTSREFVNTKEKIRHSLVPALLKAIKKNPKTKKKKIKLLNYLIKRGI